MVNVNLRRLSPLFCVLHTYQWKWRKSWGDFSQKPHERIISKAKGDSAHVKVALFGQNTCKFSLQLQMMTTASLHLTGLVTCIFSQHLSLQGVIIWWTLAWNLIVNYENVFQIPYCFGTMHISFDRYFIGKKELRSILSSSSVKLKSFKIQHPWSTFYSNKTC